MRCNICKGRTEVKLKAVSIQHEGKSHTFQAVLAEVCPKCGLIMLDDETSKSLHAAAAYGVLAACIQSRQATRLEKV